MADGKIVIETALDPTGLTKGIKSLGAAAKAGLKVATAEIAAVGTSLAAAGAYAVKTGTEFEAQMSRVKAISQATEEEFENLRQQAIELGESTAFSASEAAVGMENLAAAGFTTSEIMAAMPGLLDLAAASGEDLASSSDIAASALRGFRLDASQTAHVADVLAANANKTNSSVADTGEAMKYIAPLASAAGISLEETAAAIGIMANAGVQGSQAGTSLRAALSGLSKPTDDMAHVMEELGVSFYDSDGKMKSLTEQIAMLSGAMGGLTDEQRNNYLVTLYGQEALSGMLSLINEGAGSLNELTVAYKNCDGSAKEAAATMQDNLKGAVEELGGSLESFGIIIYDELSEGLKEAAEAATDSVDKVSDAFKSGGLKGAVKEAGEVLDDFTDSVAESNEELAGIIKPVKNVAKTGLELGKKVLPVAADGFSLVAKNLDILVPLLTSGVTAYKGYGVVKTAINLVTNSAKAWKAASAAVDAYNVVQIACTAQGVVSNATLTAGQAVVGAMTGRVTLATAAQTAWNAAMNANPIGLLITAVGALAAGITVYKLVTDEATESNGKLTEEQKKVLECCSEVMTAMKEERSAREKNVQTISREYDGYSALASELQTITDANGKVKTGYEERAKVITGLLSDALGVEISMTDGVIQKYQETIDKIKEVIVQKKAEALLNSMQSDMAEAYEKTTEAMSAYKDAAALVKEKNKAVKEATMELEAAQQRSQNTIGLSAEAMQHLGEEELRAKEKLEIATKAQKEAQKEMNASKEELSKLSTEVDNYNALMNAMASGNTAKIEEAITSLVTSYRSYNEESLKASKKTRDKMYAQANSFVENMELIQAGSVQVADSVYQDMARAAVDSIAEFNKLPGGVAQGIEEIGPEASAAMISALTQADLDGKLDAESKASCEAFLSGMSALPKETRTAILRALKPMLNETEYAKIKLKINGEKAGGEFAKGVESKKEQSRAAGKADADAAKSGASSVSSRETGNKFGAAYASGVSQKSGAASTAGATLAKAANGAKGLRSVNAGSAGENFGQGFCNGIGRMLGSAASAAASLGKKALSALSSAIQEGSPSKLSKKSGGFFGRGFQLGILEEEDNVEKASERLGNAALSGIDVSGLVEKARSVVSTENARFGRAIAAAVEYKVSGSVAASEQKNSDLDALANKIVSAFEEAGFEFKVNDRVMGRLVRRYNNA